MNRKKIINKLKKDAQSLVLDQAFIKTANQIQDRVIGETGNLVSNQAEGEVWHRLWIEMERTVVNETKNQVRSHVIVKVKYNL